MLTALKPLTGKQVIHKVLSYQDEDIWLCVHAISAQARGLGYIKGTSENSIASRLPEMAKLGIVEGRNREGKNYKEWRLKKHGDIGIES